MFFEEMKKLQCGLEREALRVNTNGAFATTKHPQALGSKLTHPNFTTDFAENQLEFITPPYRTIDGALKKLERLHRYFHHVEPKELLWPLSMPPQLPENIPIASYGTINEKEIYRIGLTKRYPIEMQLISGIHANFSFPDSLFKKLRKSKDDAYMGCIRNFLRDGWLLTYLFGASPSLEHPHSTSLRLSPHGYYSRVQLQMGISFNSLERYIKDIEAACNTPHPEYKKILSNHQLNPNILQIPGEHYTRIRPKSAHGFEGLKQGIEYLEIRALDINPYEPCGVGKNELAFTHLFLLYCLTEKSPLLTEKARKELCSFQEKVALYGRKPKLMLGKRSLCARAKELLEAMEPLADYLGLMPLLLEQIAKVENPSMTPSALLFADLEHPIGLELAKSHRTLLTKKTLRKEQLASFALIAKNSLKQHAAMEEKCAFTLQGYEDLELSTQCLIRAAHARNIHVEVLDRPHSIIRLSQGAKTEIVQQATRTAKDTYLAPLLMDNKAVTKKLLFDAGLNVPDGETFDDIETALANPSYPAVIKPNTANFGIGISFVKTHKEYKAAIEKAFRHAPSVLVEEQVPGHEVRFLIIDQRVIAVAKREPANVIGDGTHTIRQLILAKNTNPKSHKLPKEHIQLTAVEKAHLKSLHLTPTSIPKKGKKIYLRKNSNISTGGDPIDITDTVDASYKRIAIQAVQTLGANICGVDMLIPRPTTKGAYSIIELNYNPQLSMHVFPYAGTPRPVCDALLNYLGF